MLDLPLQKLLEQSLRYQFILMLFLCSYLIMMFNMFDASLEGTLFALVLYMHQPMLPLEATHFFELYIFFPSRSQGPKWRSRTGIANLEVWKIILETKTMDPIFSLPFYFL